MPRTAGADGRPRAVPPASSAEPAAPPAPTPAAAGVAGRPSPLVNGAGRAAVPVPLPPSAPLPVTDDDPMPAAVVLAAAPALIGATIGMGCGGGGAWRVTWTRKIVVATWWRMRDRSSV